MTTDEQRQDKPQQEPADWPTIKGISEKIEQARKAGKYMVAVFHVDANNKLTLDRACYGFPVVDFENAVNLLKTDLDKERAGVPDQETRKKMEQAEPQPPVINLFGTKPASPES